MDKFEIVNLSRRDFLKAGAGLTLGIVAPGAFAQGGPGQAGGTAVAAGAFAPNAFVLIGSDNAVTVIVKHLEMGQGTYTGLPTLVAEELDADWSQIRVEGAPADASRYNNLFFGQMQGTGGSTALANSYEQMRKAGAAARAILVSAAAERWNVAPESITVARGAVTHQPSDRKASIGTRPRPSSSDRTRSWPSTSALPRLRACRRGGRATSARRSPPRRERSRPPTSSPTSRTPAWSR